MVVLGIIYTKVMIRTKTPILIDPRTGRSEVVYFDKINEQRSELSTFKGEVGLYAYLIRMQIMVDGKLVDLGTIYSHLKPQQSIYKLSTWKAMFGNRTIAQMEENEDADMIAQMDAYSDQWFGLKADDFEVVPA